MDNRVFLKFQICTDILIELFLSVLLIKCDFLILGMNSNKNRLAMQIDGVINKLASPPCFIIQGNKRLVDNLVSCTPNSPDISDAERSTCDTTCTFNGF